jgi:hypothetical protein
LFLIKENTFVSAELEGNRVQLAWLALEIFRDNNIDFLDKLGGIFSCEN